MTITPYNIRCPLRHCDFVIEMRNPQAPTDADNRRYMQHLALHRLRFRELLAMADVASEQVVP